MGPARTRQLPVTQERKRRGASSTPEPTCSQRESTRSGANRARGPPPGGSGAVSSGVGMAGGAREVLTLQLGHFAGFVGAHWWNQQVRLRVAARRSLRKVHGHAPPHATQLSALCRMLRWDLGPKATRHPGSCAPTSCTEPAGRCMARKPIRRDSSSWI